MNSIILKQFMQLVAVGCALQLGPQLKADTLVGFQGPYLPGSMPGGATWSFSSSANGEIGRTGGVNWYFSGIGLASSGAYRVWWGLIPGTVKFTWDGLPYDSNEILSYSSADSLLSAGRLVWTGFTALPGVYGYTMVRLTMQVRVNGSPYPLTSTAGLPLSSGMGGVVEVTSGMAYSVNLLFEAQWPASSWMPAYEAYDTWRINNYITNAPAALSDVTAGFYFAHWQSYEPGITDQPVDVATVAGTNTAFSVGAKGYSLKYAWSRYQYPSGSGAVIWPGKTSSVLQLTNVQYNDWFQVAVSNALGVTNSRWAQLRVTNTPGYEIKPPLEADLTKTGAGGPTVSPSSGGFWDGSKLWACNSNTTPLLVTVIWKATNSTDLSRSVYVRPTTVAPYEVGQEIQPPSGVDLSKGATSVPADATYWHAQRRKLYATAPVSAQVKWLNSNNGPIYENVVLAWPPNPSRYQIYVANSTPAYLSNGWSDCWVSLRAAESSVGADKDDVRSYRRFKATGAGSSLLLLSRGNPDLANNIYFQFVKSIVWTNSTYLSNATATIGTAIPRPEYHTATNEGPYVLNRLSRYCTNFYDPNANRWGPIIPVNRDRTNTLDDDMVVVYYQIATNLWDVSAGAYTNTTIAWACRPARYNCQWPTDPPQITIASQKGTGPRNEGAARVYVQSDPNQPGYNPNEEHALRMEARGVLPQLRVNPSALMVLEGASNAVQVWLTSLPAGTTNNTLVTVSSSRSGLTNLYSPQANPTNSLSFTPGNYSVPQAVQICAVANTNVLAGSNLFTLAASGGLFDQQQVLAHYADTNVLGLVVDALAFTVVEGQSRDLNVRLTRAPASAVTVTISKATNSFPAVDVTGPVVATFSSADWDTPKTFRIEVGTGSYSDGTDGTTLVSDCFRVQASGGLDEFRDVIVTPLDKDLQTAPAFYALRCDLGDPPGTNSPTTSEPYVLISYTNTSGVGAMLVYQVMLTNQTWPSFGLSGKAGRLIQPPYPISYLVNWEQKSTCARGPAFQDRKKFYWARAAGDDGGSTNIVMRFWYPVGSDFYFPEGFKSAGTLTPLLDRLPGGTQGVPMDLSYTISWPDDPPELKMGETLVQAKFGLPSIQGQESVAVIYQQAVATGRGQSVQVIDATSPYSASLAVLPPDAIVAANPLDGTVWFTGLPPHLRTRLWYVPGEQKLKFKGEFRLESGIEEPTGYVLLNVMTLRDKTEILALSPSHDTAFVAAVESLASQAASAKPVGPNDPYETPALTAGMATSGGYVTLAFNDGVRPDLPTNRPGPVALEVIRVTCPLYVGEVKTLYSEDPFDEKVTLRHTGDFGGQADRYVFQWQYSPSLLDPLWTPVPLVPETGQGALDTVVKGSGVRTLVDGWYQCRYMYASENTNRPCGDTWSEWTSPGFVEGWTKRVTRAINPFDQKFTNLITAPVDTLVSVIGQAGPRWIGDVPLNAAALTNKGLIEIYESVLKRGIELSIEGTPASSGDPNVSRALLTVARRISDLYLLLGNEAYADAEDPTIGFGTEDGQYGSAATSIHCFMDQTASLIDEELALLRGMDDSKGFPVAQNPAYNRLRWNFSRNITGGEVAYALNYNIHDSSGTVQKSISEASAKKLYPQGHGDAWGHYLTATKVFYRLLRNPNFVWSSDTDYVTIDGAAVPVGYADERKFAQAAAAKARAGAELTSLTYRSAYLDDPSGQWQGYLDGNTNRAWGVSEWASRAGQGALFDWVTCNALLPPVSTVEGPAKVDRTTVTELRDLASAYLTIQDQMDKADSGLNPLGLAKNVIPFDVDPAEIVKKNSQFEQVYSRALAALKNAVAVFNYAQGCSQLLRRQADSQVQFQKDVADREADFNSRLIEVFGYPYSDDIGPTGTYPSGYSGPDYFHYMVTDFSKIIGEPSPQAIPLIVTLADYQVSDNGSVTRINKPVTYYLGINGIGVVKPALWTGTRRAPGELQSAHSDLLQAKARFDKARAEYDALISSIEDEAGILQQQYALNAGEIGVLNKGINTITTLNQAIYACRQRQMDFQTGARMATLMANAAAEALPKVSGLDNDFTSIARSAILFIGNASAEILSQSANAESMAELDQQNAKELAQAQQNLELTTLRQEQAVLTEVAKLQQMVRQEVLLRLEIYTQEEAMQQVAGRYQAALAKGQRLMEDRFRFRQQTAAKVQEFRYKDMAFRIFRNEALQKYRAQFDQAALYVFLAAKAYDYETNLRPGDPGMPGSFFMNEIVRARALGTTTDGSPQACADGDSTLADAMFKMYNNFMQNLKPRLGLLNPQDTALEFSLRRELLRVLPSASGSTNWRTALASYRVSDLHDVPEVRQYTQFANSQAEPGLVIPLPTTVNKDANYFGQKYGQGDNRFSEEAASIKIYSVGVSFFNYRSDPSSSGGMGNTPFVYLVPVGNDILRCRYSAQDTNRFTRPWKVVEQWLPVPFPLSGAGDATLISSNYIPAYSVQQGQQYLGTGRAFPQIYAWHDSLQVPVTDPTYNSTLMVSRSVWNTKWLLIIPASGLGADYEEYLNRFIYGGKDLNGKRDGNGVSDIRLRIKAYWYSAQ